MMTAIRGSVKVATSFYEPLGAHNAQQLQTALLHTPSLHLTHPRPTPKCVRQDEFQLNELTV